jgi:spoIIIJ-associated protein
MDELRADGRGATLGEAKWNAAKELERQVPGVSQDDIDFEVLEEGDESAGVEAHVVGSVDADAGREAAAQLPDEPPERVRAVVGRIVHALELEASVDVSEDDEEIRATVNGDDLGLLIGKHGSTIDAIQHVAFRAAFRGAADRKRVVVDAAGYRERREAALKRQADRAVEDALSYGRPVELDPMGSHERRVVHQYLTENPEVQTHSEGDEPERRLVVSPVRARRDD